MKDEVETGHFTTVTYPAHELNSIERMEDTWKTGNDKTHGRILGAAGQTLGRGIGPELVECHGLFDLGRDIFIDSIYLVDYAGDRGN